MAKNILSRIKKKLSQKTLPEIVAPKIEEKHNMDYWYKNTEMVNNKIMFFTFQGRYTCNPKYICNKIIEQGYDWDLVWVVNREEDKELSEFPKEVRCVVKDSEEYYQELYSAHIWIDNGFCVTRKKVKKRPEQVYIETLHGSLGIKKIGPEDVANEKRNRRGYRCGKLATYCISNSKFEDEVFRTSFWPDTEILEYGHARNDFLLTEDRQLIAANRQKVLDYFGMEPDVNLAMYAPTFREKSLSEEDIEEIDFEMLRESLIKRFGGKWAIICRTHARDKGKREQIEHVPGVYNGAEYPDMQELILAVDVGITDYSSWIFDYVLLGKAGFIYSPDLALYDAQRGFYYPIETAPFPVATSNAMLTDKIENFDYETFKEDVKAFLQEKGCVDDGKASLRIVEKLREIVGDEN